MINLPPDVSESQIPGNRPDDEEIEFTLVLTIGDIQDLKQFYQEQMAKPCAERHYLWCFTANVIEQINYDLKQD